MGIEVSDNKMTVKEQCRNNETINIKQKGIKSEKIPPCTWVVYFKYGFCNPRGSLI